jgi:hypothetical protein
MKRSQAIALSALTTTLAAGITFLLLYRRKQARRRDFVANEGYELAYDIHYPMRYGKPARASRRNGADHSNANESSAF